MNPSEDPNDRLIDSLLKEQARHAADEDLLQAIEDRLEESTARSAGSDKSWRGRVLAVAALTMIGGIFAWHSSTTPSRHDPVELAVLERSEPRALHSHEAPSVPSEDPIIFFNAGKGSIDVPPANLIGSTHLPVPPPTIEDAEFARLSGEAGVPFGDGDDFGDGWGTGGDGGGGGGSVPPGDSTGLPAEEIGIVGSKSTSGKVIRREIPPRPSKPSMGPPVAEDASRENYGPLVDQPWRSPWQDALSTFSIDVDTASYTNLRRMILEGRPVPADAVRIEECINYFDYRYETPKGDSPFAVQGTLATCPWQPQHLLARVAIKGREIDAKARPASNLVFLIDVSGSMQDPLKLPLLKRSMRVLLDQLDERDRLGIVVYAGSQGVVLDPTVLDERGLSAAIQALEKLEAGGSTNGGAGIKRAYEMASQHLVAGGVNRVILATDGDFNVGTTGQGDLVSLVKKGAANGVSLSVIGFGTGNLNDSMMEAITNDGNGNYFYIDGDQEAHRVFLQKLTGTLVTIAKDVKIQVEFNPGKVQAYRLIGYANRILRHEDFTNDKIDAGDIGAGHTVTAFYEIVPPGVPMPGTGSVDPLRYQKPAERAVVESDDWFTLKLRHKHPEGEVSSLVETPVKGEPVAWEHAGNDFRFASAVALFGMKLRQMPEMADVSWSKVMEIARPALAEDPQEQRAGFVEMVSRHSKIPVPAMESVATESSLDGLRFVREESVMWYVQFGFESQGKWAPKIVARTAGGKKAEGKVSALEMISPGDTFFKEGFMAGRFKFLGIVEKEVVSERTKLSQMVKFAQYEDLKPNKKGERYESQYGLPEAQVTASAYFDRTAVMEFEGKEFKVEERTGFSLPPGGEDGKFFLKQVTPERIVVEFSGADGKAVVREIGKK